MFLLISFESHCQNDSYFMGSQINASMAINNNGKFRKSLLLIENIENIESTLEFSEKSLNK